MKQDYTHIRWNITDARRAEYAASSRAAQDARKVADELAATRTDCALTVAYDPNDDMPRQPANGLKRLSLFSGGGGLDLGFERAGFEHLASFEALPFAGDTLRANRPDWKVYSGEDGEVARINWSSYRHKIDVLYAAPPRQPFSIAGRRAGARDARDMFPELVRAVDEIRPKVFVAENVAGFLSRGFDDYREALFERLVDDYDIETFILSAAEFGVPQDRRSAFVVGVQKELGRHFDPAKIQRSDVRRGVREALGLPLLGADGLAPTLRSTLTGPRQTTSIANSTASVTKWASYGIWPHGVSPSRSVAAAFPTKDDTYRLCVEECQILQGFPLDWAFAGPVYQRLGLIGSSVCPPVAYAVARSVHAQVLHE